MMKNLAKILVLLLFNLPNYIIGQSDFEKESFDIITNGTGFSINNYVKVIEPDGFQFNSNKSNNLDYIFENQSQKIELYLSIEKRNGNIYLFSPEIKNFGEKDFSLKGFSDFIIIVDAKNINADSSYKFWSLQGGTYPQRYDWIFSITKNYSRKNFFGNNEADYGGGMPVIDLWTKEKGFLFADLSIIPPIISLPVKVNKDGLVNISRVYEEEINIEAGTSKKLNPSAFIFHNPDFYNGLVYYSDLISERGLKIPKSPSSALEPEWCAWGYERDFNTSQIISTLPLVKKMGLKWVTLDDGWQNANGDWGFSKSKFPNGKTEFIEFVNKIKSEGFKFRLWWTPFDAHDSSYNEIHYKDRMNEFGMKFQSELAKDHPDWFMLDVNGNRYQVSWWNSYLLCPELTEVQEYYKSFIEKAIKEWGIEGLKIDGQHFNLVPPCYNKKHHHKSPYDASKAVPQFFKIIYDAAKSIDTNFVFNLCPCGTNFSVYNLPYASQTVSSDPSSSWQVRHRGKIFNALSKGSMSYSGDHVELTNRKYDESTNKWVTYKKEDFVSTLAVGGVPSTKFTLEGIEQAEPGYSLTVDKLPLWKKWIDFYNNEKLGRCRYLNLYDIAYSIPETHVLKNDSSGVYYYFFFSSGEFSGEVELKGLDDKEYLIYDVKNERYTDDYNGEKIKITFIDDAVYKLIPKGN